MSAASTTPITVDLLRRHAVRGPRYTSYPTALHFDEAVGPDTLREELRRTRRSPRPLSLYFHMLYCRQLCWYCACTRDISRRQGVSGAYLEALLAEVDLRSPDLAEREVVQIHLGGGTPTFFLPGELERLIGHVRDRFALAEDAEIALEVDPRELTEEHVEALGRAGFNRASLGVQDVEPAVQAAINRVQPMEQTRWAAEALRAAGVEGLNLDLVYGLPLQTVDSISRTLEQVLELDPDRLAIYGYAHVPWMQPAQKLLERHHLPDSEERLEMLQHIIATLEGAGYVYIGMDHFARPDDELAQALAHNTLQRNFQGYSTRGGADIHGFGASAISATERVYAQNHKDVDAWRAAIARGEMPTARGYETTWEDRLRRRMIMDVMCHSRVDLDALAVELELPDLREHFAPELARLARHEAEGLVHIDGPIIEVTPLGRHFLRNLAMCFDAYLGQGKEQTQRYSKTV